MKATDSAGPAPKRRRGKGLPAIEQPGAVAEVEPDRLQSSDWRALFEQYAAHDDRGLLLMGPRRRVLAINPCACELLGYSGEVPVPLAQVVHDVNLGFAVGDAFHDRRDVYHELYMPDPDRLLRIHITPILAASGEPVLTLATVEDITRSRHLETVRRDFVANVSHELRTPLASINLLVETLQNGGLQDPAAAAHFLQRIQVETQSMAQLVEELLELSRLESGRLSLHVENVSLRTAMEETANRLAPLAHEKGIEMLLELPDALPCVRADARRLEQILLNLVHNAIKFTPAGGKVTLRARRAGLGVEIEVADTGVGMDQAEARRVFERFYKVDRGRSRAEGSGLGLAISRHLVELHGGRLQVVSEVGRGSVFSFALPVAA